MCMASPRSGQVHHWICAPIRGCVCLRVVVDGDHVAAVVSMRGWRVAGARGSQDGQDKKKQRRILDTRQVPLKKQVEWARSKKEKLEKHGHSGPKVRTSFRRQRPKEEDANGHPLKKKTSMSAAGGIEDLMMGAGADRKPPALLVDGYNVCGQWKKLKKKILAGDLEDAREGLEAELVDYSHTRGIQVVVVWDAGKSGSKGMARETTSLGLEVVFIGDTTADEFIEAEVPRLREEGTKEIWVATSDHQQQIVAGGNGAYIMSGGKLISEIKKAKANADLSLKEQMQNQSHAYRLVGDGLEKGTIDALFNLRSNLLQQAQQETSEHPDKADPP